MRTEKELWEVVLSRKDLFEHGLCNWVDKLYWIDLITIDEKIFLGDFLNENLPIKKFSGYIGYSAIYSFPYGQIQPRIDWIKKRIETL